METQNTTALNVVTPSGAAEAIRTMRGSGISLYIHGAPGISKSSVAKQVADQERIAFIDIRLSQFAPEDVRGIPSSGEIDGMRGMIWEPPLLYPRDLNYEGIAATDETGIAIVRFFNPIGNNGVHYCTSPQVSALSLTDAEVSITIRENSFVIRHHNESGPVQGNVHWTVKGAVQAILCLEEFNSATPSVMAAAYQLILDRRIGEYIVPDGVMLLAMGNRDSDRGVTHQMVKPVANRFVHLEMQFDFDDWFAWAGAQDIHPDVLGYLSKWKSNANSFDPDSPHHAFATPRSWEYVSKIISRPLPSSDTLRALICGAIGDAIGAEFMQHRKFMEDIPLAADILDGKVTEFRPKNPRFETQISYSVCVQICYELKRREVAVQKQFQTDQSTKFNDFPPRRQWLQEADRGFSYAIDNFRPEVSIMICRLAIAGHGLQINTAYMPKLRTFMSNYRDALTGR
jgi:MoxR-like ATPase